MTSTGPHLQPRGEYLWWLSFIDTTLTPPEGEQVPGGVSFLGVAIVAAPDFLTAARRAWAKGCNPGGQCQGSGPFPLGSIPEKYLHRLLTADEANEVNDTVDPWGGEP